MRDLRDITYGRKVKRVEEKKDKPPIICPSCGMLNHKTNRSKACFANPQHKLHSLFHKNYNAAIVASGDDIVAQQQSKKRKREAMFIVPEDLLFGVLHDADKSLCLRARKCLDCADGVMSGFVAPATSVPG